MPAKKATPDTKKDSKKSPPSLPPLLMFSDEPIQRLMAQEGLDADRFSETIARVCRGVEGPFNIGVFAGWGEGKTTALRQAQARLDETARSQDNPGGHDIVTVWVNAWKYEHDQHPMLPLIACIVDEVEQKLKAMERNKQGNIIGPAADFFKKVSIGLRALAHSTTVELSGNILPGLGAGIQLDTGKWAEEYDKLSRIHDPMLDQSIFFKADNILTQLYKSFEEAKKKSKEPQGRKEDTKIVIFIDDLDRCLPDKAMALLESIKLVLAHPGFVFCMAIDRNPVDAFLQKRYKKDFGMKEYAKASGGHYLDKLIQLPLHLPRRTQQFEGHIDFLIKDYRDKAKMSAQLIDGDDLSESLDALLVAAPAMAKGTDSNPRSLVRLLNRLLFDRISWQARREEDSGLMPVPEFLQFAAISRMLQDKLERKYYLMLALDEGQFSKWLLEWLPPSNISDYFPGPNMALPEKDEYEEYASQTSLIEKYGREQSFFKTSQAIEKLELEALLQKPDFSYSTIGKLYSLCKELDERPYLKEMLRTPLGQHWLKEDDNRRQVEEYLVSVTEKLDEEEKATKPDFEEHYHRAQDGNLTDESRAGAIGVLGYYFSKRTEVYKLINDLAKDADIPDILRASAIRMLCWRYTNRPGSFELIKDVAERDNTLHLTRKEAILALAAHYLKRDEAFELLKQLLFKGRLSEELRKLVLYEIRNFEFVQSPVRQWCAEQGFFKEYGL